MESKKQKSWYVTSQTYDKDGWTLLLYNSLELDTYRMYQANENSNEKIRYKLNTIFILHQGRRIENVFFLIGIENFQ